MLRREQRGVLLCRRGCKALGKACGCPSGEVDELFSAEVFSVGKIDTIIIRKSQRKIPIAKRIFTQESTKMNSFNFFIPLP